MKVGDIIQSGPFAGLEVLDVYTREQAIKDGVLMEPVITIMLPNED